MIKSLYLTKRQPDLTPDAFVRRWRMHGALAMSKSFWRDYLLYVQAEVLRPVSIPGASGDYDGIAYLATTDEAVSRTWTAQELADGETVLQDEKETFASPIPPVTLTLDEEVLKKSDPGGVAAFLFYLDAAAAKAPAQRLRSLDKANRVVLNRRGADNQFGSVKCVLPYQAVVEVTATDLTNLKEVIAALGKPAASIADLVVVTREAVLWDRISNAPAA